VASSREYLLAETIYNKWTATTALGTSCPGGLKFIETKQPADTSAISEPYANFTIDIVDVINSAGTTVQVITAIVTFSIFGGVSLAVSGALGDVQATFSGAQSLTNPTGGLFLAMIAEPGSGMDKEMWRRGGKLNRRGTHKAKVVFQL
jgi:hypothetical protein